MSFIYKMANFSISDTSTTNVIVIPSSVNKNLSILDASYKYDEGSNITMSGGKLLQDFTIINGSYKYKSNSSRHFLFKFNIQYKTYGIYPYEIIQVQITKNGTIINDKKYCYGGTTNVADDMMIFLKKNDIINIKFINIPSIELLKDSYILFSPL